MCTKYKSIFDALAAQFEPGQVKARSQAGRTFSYVTARTIMNRLDSTVGPENWWDDYTPLDKSVICRLSIRLPDGTIVTKADAGGCAGMADAGDDDKSGFSDAFKRAAVKFGVSRYLYGDGVARLAGPAPPPAVAGVVPGSPPPSPPSKGGRRETVASSDTDAPDTSHRPPFKGGDGGGEQRATNVDAEGDGQAPAEAAKPSDKVSKIQTGPELYAYAKSCPIDPKLVRWILGTFREFPALIGNWNRKEVEAALPEIKIHLESMRTQKKDQAA